MLNRDAARNYAGYGKFLLQYDQLNKSQIKFLLVSKYKFAPALALKWYPQGYSGSHWPSELVWHLCSQSESGRQMHLQASHFSFGPQEGAFYRGQFAIRPRVLIIMINNNCSLTLPWVSFWPVTTDNKSKWLGNPKLTKVIDLLDAVHLWNSTT